MFLPIAADTGDRKTPVVNLSIIAVTTLVSLLALPGLDAACWSVLDGRPVEGWLGWLLLTRRQPATTALVGHALLHGGLLHLFGNMLVLWVLGNALELRLGRWRYLGLYLAGAVAGAIGFLASDGPAAVGASGAIMAVAGAFLIFLPFQRVVVLFPALPLVYLGLWAALQLVFRIEGAPLFALVLTAPAYWVLALRGASDAEEGLLLRVVGFRSIGLPGLLLVGGWVALDLLAALSPATDGVAHVAHLTGAAAGATIATSVLLLGAVAPIDRTLLHLLGWRRPLAARPKSGRLTHAETMALRDQHNRATFRARPRELSYSGWLRLREAGDRP